MKVLILSTYEKTGGAAIAAGRLRQALERRGVEVAMLWRRNIRTPRLLRRVCPPLARALEKQSWTSIMERAVIWAAGGFSRKDLWATDIALFGQNITGTREYREADVVHLHWVNQGFVSLSAIRRFIGDGKRVVWTMHDAWNTAGMYHLMDQWQDSRLERWTERRKMRLYALDGIRFVACSGWLTEVAHRSRLMRSLPVRRIPNPIDTETFRPLRAEGRGRRILFVAQKVDNPMKGIRYLEEAVALLKGDDAVRLTALGRDMPYIDNAEDMARLYNEVDAFVLPSLSENLPNTIMEAMACGTPCVGFGIGGIPEMIDHRENGYVARYRDAKDLAEGIRYVLDSKNHERLGKAAREKVLRSYSEESVAIQYIKLYNS